MYSISEFSKKLNVSIQTLRNWDKCGKLKANRKPSGRFFYTHEQYLETSGSHNYKRDGSDLDNIVGKRVLITGGSGSLGNQLTRRLCGAAKKIIIYSRCELTQANMRQNFQNHNNIRFLIGDVRDKNRLMYATRDIDICIHAAAQKRVESCSYNPFEAVKTNVIGSMNVLESCMENGVPKVVMVSTDKSCNAVTLYGGTKFVAEQMFINGSNYVSKEKTILTAVRYGNIFGSNGSIKHIFAKQAKEDGAITVTHPEMTRFFMSIDDSVDLILFAINNSIGGEIFIPKMKSIKITKFVDMFFPGVPVKIIGLRGHEKIHEELISESESRYVVDCGKYYKIIPPDANTPGLGWDASYPKEKTLKPFKYSSDMVNELTKEDIQSFDIK